MPMFYFNLIDDGDNSPDTEGSAFPSFELAYLATHRAARDMSWEMIQRGKDPRTCCFEITDAAMRPLAVVPFEEVLDHGAFPLALTPAHQRTPSSPHDVP